jgi:hypothetical protein
MFLSGDCGEIIDLNRRSAIDASCQVSVPLARQLQRRLLEIDESETRIAKGTNFWFIWQSGFRGEEF